MVGLATAMLSAHLNNYTNQTKRLISKKIATNLAKNVHTILFNRSFSIYSLELTNST